jgi:hypothetical protein
MKLFLRLKSLQLTASFQDQFYPIIEECPFCACADLIREKRWCDRYEVQLIAI